MSIRRDCMYARCGRQRSRVPRGTAACSPCFTVRACESTTRLQVPVRKGFSSFPRCAVVAVFTFTQWIRWPATTGGLRRAHEVWRVTVRRHVRYVTLSARTLTPHPFKPKRCRPIHPASNPYRSKYKTDFYTKASITNCPGSDGPEEILMQHSPVSLAFSDHG